MIMIIKMVYDLRSRAKRSCFVEEKFNDLSLNIRDRLRRVGD